MKRFIVFKDVHWIAHSRELLRAPTISQIQTALSGSVLALLMAGGLEAILFFVQAHTELVTGCV